MGQLKFKGGFEIGTGGWVDTPNQRLQVQHQLPALSGQELAGIPIGVGNDAQPIHLSDVAEIRDDACRRPCSPATPSSTTASGS